MRRVALYGAETWIKADRGWLAALKCGFGGEQKRQGWVDKINNKELLQKVQESRSILDRMQ